MTTQPLATTEFTTDGFTRLPEFLSAADVDSVSVAVDRHLVGARGESCARPNNTLVPLRWSDSVVDLVLADQTRVRRVVDALTAADLRWISGYVSVKDPHSSPLWWHQDWWCWDHPISVRPAPAQVALLCYLTDTNGQTGALRVLPGSHVRSTPLHAVLPAAHRDPSTAEDLEHDVMRDHPGQVTLDTRAGDAVLTDYRLLHGTHANASDRRRDCVLLSFTPSWRELPADVRAHLISHPALPRPEERPPHNRTARLLPSYSGPRRDLTLNRDAPVS